MSEDRGVAVVTGASSGIGAAAVRRLGAAGFRVVCGARRMDKLREVAESCGAKAISLDVTDPASVGAFAASVPECRLLAPHPVADGIDQDKQADFNRNRVAQPHGRLDRRVEHRHLFRNGARAARPFVTAPGSTYDAADWFRQRHFAGTASMRRLRWVSSRYSSCHSLGPFDGDTCTAVTLYSGQFVAQSE